MTRADKAMTEALEAIGQEECPICGSPNAMNEVCHTCGTDPDDVFVCSYRRDSADKRYCQKTAEPCTVRGLDYEQCPVLNWR